MYFVFKIALGEKLLNIAVRDNVMMLRYFEEYYVYENKLPEI